MKGLPQAAVVIGLLGTFAVQSLPTPLSSLPPRPEVSAPLVKDLYPDNRDGRRARRKAIKA